VGSSRGAARDDVHDDASSLIETISCALRTVAFERRRSQEMSQFMARHDPLTGLPGRFALLKRLNELSSTGRGGGALLLLDLDNFALVNDRFGPQVGDAVLLDVATRVADAFPGMMVARCGADEFAVVASDAVGRDAALHAVGRVCDVLEPDVEFGHHSLRVTASMGVATQPTWESAWMLMRKVDLSLALAKEAGIGHHRLYEPQMHRQVHERLAIRDGLQVALNHDQLRLEYQPIVSLADRRIVGSEALLRWKHPSRGDVAPVDFIPIAEESGLIEPIGRWVMNTACADAVSVHRDHGTYVSVNVSTRQLMGHRFAAWVERVLLDTGLPPTALVVEVTESALMDDVGRIGVAFDRLRSLGVRVAIDDFGTGYSSLARLQHLPVDIIKLDRAFVTGIAVRSVARGMASAILQLADAIGAAVVAEGVETEAEAATLLELGCTAAQGYLFAPSTSLHALTGRLAGQRHPPGPAGAG